MKDLPLVILIQYGVYLQVEDTVYTGRLEDAKAARFALTVSLRVSTSFCIYERKRTLGPSFRGTLVHKKLLAETLVSLTYFANAPLCSGVRFRKVILCTERDCVCVCESDQSAIAMVPHTRRQWQQHALSV